MLSAVSGILERSESLKALCHVIAGYMGVKIATINCSLGIPGSLSLIVPVFHAYPIIGSATCMGVKIIALC